MKFNLCLFTDSLEPSGLGESMLSLASELRLHYRVSFVCPPTRAGVALLERARRLSLDTLALEVRGERAAWEMLLNWLRSRRIDIFHIHAGIGWEGHDAVYAARAALTPLILRTEHLPDLITDQRQRIDYQRMTQRVDHIICVCAAARASFMQAGVPAEKLSVVRNGVQPRVAKRDPRVVKANLGLPPQARMVLTVARLSEQKGHRHLLEAIPAVLARAPDTYFVWVGEGPLEGDLRARISQFDLAERILLLGRRDDVPDLMAASDLFVLPSLFEGLPIVVLEAMGAGLPVVGTSVCGTSEVVADGISGRLVPARDAAALAAAVLEVLTQPSVAARWGAAGKLRLAHEFSATRMAHETMAIYQALWHQRKSSHLKETTITNVMK